METVDLSRFDLIPKKHYIPKKAPYLGEEGLASDLRGIKNLERESFRARDKNDNCEATTIRHDFLSNRVK